MMGRHTNLFIFNREASFTKNEIFVEEILYEKISEDFYEFAKKLSRENIQNQRKLLLFIRKVQKRSLIYIFMTLLSVL